MFNIPFSNFHKTISDTASRVKDIPQQLSQKANSMMTAVKSNEFIDARNLDARDLMARAANPSITGEVGRQPGAAKGGLQGKGYANILEYPSNLGSERYPHYVTFFINEYVQRGGENREGTTGYLNVQRNIDKYNVVGGGLARGASGLATGIRNKGDDLVAAGKSNGDVTGGVTGIAKEGAGKVASGVGGALQKIGMDIKRTTDAIVLYMPNQLRAQYGADYEEFSNASIAGSALIAAANANSLTEAGGALVDSAGNLGAEFARSVVGAGAKMAGMEGAFAAIDKIRGKIQNPRTEVVFRTIAMRRHEYNFIFSPRNLTESATINSIINLFKQHMHPEVQTKTDSTGNYLIMPSEFDIEFYYMNEENNLIPKVLTCVLESCAVDYTPNNMWSTFDGVAFPTHITMSLQFKELEPLTREHILKGF